MIKAFLSHSSIDKDVVRLIKKQLKRIYTYFDEDCFEAGEDFRAAICSRLEDTSLFVLFASHNSIRSAWVEYEMDEAFWQMIKGGNIGLLVLTLEDISVNQLPPWMRKYKFENVTTPKIAAQVIRKNLFEGTNIDQKVIMGREQDIIDMNQDINQAASDFPNIIALTGLDGIGRRTFASEFFSKRFSLDYSIEFELEHSDDVTDLYIKLLDENMDDFSSSDIAESTSLFSKLTNSEKMNEVARLLALFSDHRTYPIIIDNGSMLDDFGYYKKEFVDIFNIFANRFRDQYLLLIHKRLPRLNHSYARLIYRKRLNALDPENTYSLFNSLLIRNRIAINSPAQVGEIARHLEGYPPAIIYATTECKLSGIDVVCSDKESLLDFQSGIFTNYLSKLPLESLDDSILETLYYIGGMSIDMLSTLLLVQSDDIAKSIRKCLDFNIIEEHSNGLYRIASPINVAISRKYTPYTAEKYAEIAHLLISKYWENNTIQGMMTINLIITTLFRAKMDQELLKFKEYVLQSHLLRAASDAYNQSLWEDAENYARKALEVNMSLDDARSILVKSLIRQENNKNISRLNEEENRILNEMEKNGDRRFYYLKGFREWKRSNFYDAIEMFLLAKAAGDDSIQLHRDLAECYYQTGNSSAAKKEIDTVMEPPRKINNAFILDLASKIAIENNDYDLADILIARQSLVDHAENVAHRKATYYLKKKDYQIAMIHATEACTGKHPLPQMYTLRMNIGVHSNEFDIVEQDYWYLKEEYRWFNPDLREIIYCNMVLKKAGWKQATAAFSNINNKSSSIALNMRLKILNATLADEMAPALAKNNAAEEKSRINMTNTKDVLIHMSYYNGRRDNLDDGITTT